MIHRMSFLVNIEVDIKEELSSTQISKLEEVIQDGIDTTLPVYFKVPGIDGSISTMEDFFISVTKIN